MKTATKKKLAVVPEPVPLPALPTDKELRDWSRIAFPYLRGMTHAQVWSNRRKWARAVRYLGRNWTALKTAAAS